MNRTFRRIALVLHEDSLYIRDILRGIHGFSLQRDWLLRLTRPEVDVENTLREWCPQGIVTHVTTASLAESLRCLQCPAVDVADIFSTPPFPHVGVHDHAVGAMAAEHLFVCGTRHFGFVGLGDWHFSRVRGDAFRRGLNDRGCDCAFLELTSPQEASAGLYYPGDQEDRLLDWLQSLSKPVGLFAANDYVAFEVVNACRRGDFTVPEQVSVLGVDNDELLCELCDPPLSSVAIPTGRIGHEAASLLERMMDGTCTDRQQILLQPLAIIPRRSTDRRIVEDSRVSRALSFIHDRRGQPISVEDVLRSVKVSRRTLERAFRRELGRTPLQEIRRVHLEQVKALLSQTELRIEEVAWQTGFSDGKHLATVFKQETGMTPLEFRRRGQLPTAPV